MKDQYKNIATWYDRIFEPMNIGLRKIGLRMSPVKENMNVLDVGCGTGSHLSLYQKANCNIFGIDLSPAMLKVAKEKLGENADLKLCNATETEYDDEMFDLILSSTVLHEMSENIRIEVIKEAKRILKSDGKILLIDFHPGTKKNFKGIYTKIIITIAEIFAGRVHFKNYRHFMKNGGLPILIENTGLKIIDKKIVSGGNFGIFLLDK